MTAAHLLVLILLPLVAGVLVVPLRRPGGVAREGIALAATAVNLFAAILFFGRSESCSYRWAEFGLYFSLRLDHFSGFILLGAAAFGLLVSLYSVRFMRGQASANQYYAYLLLSLAMVNGAVLADHLVVLLFFWEGLLLTIFGMIAIGSPGAYRTATKAFIIVGVTDLCMMVGIALTGWISGTLTISILAQGPLPATGLGGLAMVLLLIGAISKAGSMPFHSWIPDAAISAPLPFMALLPASLEKLLGIYFLARISMDMYQLTAESWVSWLLMSVGAATILLAVMMAVIQKDYRRLLSFHAISQVGYMVLGIGTALPVGIVGGLFHMVNNALYKSGLFLTGGAVQRQAGTYDLEKLGGLARKMPVTFACFLITAAAISGVPPLNGFFSKELVFDAARERSVLLYLAALAGSFFTAISFLKLGHATYFGKRAAAHEGVREAPFSMLVPMVVIAGLCVLFGVYNVLPLRQLIEPVLGAERLHGASFAGMPANALLAAVAVLTLVGALVHHLFGARRGGSGVRATEHIHHAVVLGSLYERAERGDFDPYNIGLGGARGLARLCWTFDRMVDWVYNRLAVGLATELSRCIRRAHTGNYALYILWALMGALAMVIFLVKSV
jgi:formate hydrogenlyase subunit 3/multisubunit Na+/H+ antiporter MnhD subunit